MGLQDDLVILVILDDAHPECTVSRRETAFVESPDANCR